MTRNVPVQVWNLAVAVISIMLFTATPVSLATHQISSFHAIFMMIGSTIAGAVALFGVRDDMQPWPIRIFETGETPAQNDVRPSLIDWLRQFDWTGRAQGA